MCIECYHRKAFKNHLRNDRSFLSGFWPVHFEVNSMKLRKLNMTDSNMKNYWCLLLNKSPVACKDFALKGQRNLYAFQLTEKVKV